MVTRRPDAGSVGQGPGRRWSRRRRPVLLLAVLVVTVSALGACDATKVDERGADANADRRHPSHEVDEVRQMRTRWTRSGASALLASGSAVYASVADGVSSLDPASGSSRWHSVAATIPAAVGNGMVYALSGRSTVVALDPVDGAVRWRRTVGADVPAVVLRGTTLYAGDSRLDARTGAVVWSRRDNRTRVLAADGSQVYLTTPDRAGCPTGETIEAVRPADGSAVWTVHWTGQVTSRATVNDATLFLTPVVCVGFPSVGTVLALDARTGAHLETAEFSPAAAAPGRLIGATVTEAGIAAVSSADLAPIWTVEQCGSPYRGEPFEAPVIAGALVWWPEGGRVCAYRLDDGTTVGSWPVPTGDGLIVAGGCTYVSGRQPDGDLVTTALCSPT